MRPSARLQLVTCLMLYASCAHAIMVKFGTKGGPIEPPPPEPPTPPPAQPYRKPAPVWEERANDTPDPNAQWRPTLFIPQPRYTQVEYNPSTTQQPINNAKSFVSSYLPKHQPVQAQPITSYFTPSQILSSQSLPGYGIRYFVPEYLTELQQRKEQLRQEDAQINHIESNEVDESRDSASDAQWKYEKEAAKRVTRQLTTVQVGPYPYVWPEFFPRRYY